MQCFSIVSVADLPLRKAIVHSVKTKNCSCPANKVINTRYFKKKGFLQLSVLISTQMVVDINKININIKDPNIRL